MSKLDKSLLWILAAGVLIRLLAAVYLDAKGSQLHDNFGTKASFEFASMAQGLLKEGQFTYFKVGGVPTPSSYQPPAYPLLFAGIFAVLGWNAAGFIFLQLLQIAMGGWTILLAWRLAELMRGRTAAVATAALTAFHPLLIYLPNEAHSINLLIPMFLLGVLAAFRLIRDPDDRPASIALALSSLMLVLIRSEGILGVLLFCGLLAFTQGSKMYRPAAAAAALSLAAVLCWVSWNHSRMDHWTLTTTANFNMWIGDHKGASGGSSNFDGTTPQPPADIQAKIDSLPWTKDYEVQMDQLYAEALHRDAAEDPLTYLRPLPAKVGMFLTSDITHPKGKNKAVILLNVAVWPFVILGLLQMRGQWRKYWPILFWPVLLFLIILPTFMLPRYRIQFEPFLLVLSGIGIAGLLEKKSGPAPQ